MSDPSLYRPHFTPAERKLLLAVPADDVSSEIHLLRVLLTRTLGLGTGQKTQSRTIQQHAALLRALGGAAIIMAGLVGYMARYHGRTDELSALLLEQLSAMDPNDL